MTLIRQWGERKDHFVRWVLYGIICGVCVLLIGCIVGVSLLPAFGAESPFGTRVGLFSTASPTPTSIARWYNVVDNVVRIRQLPHPLNDVNCANSGYDSTAQCNLWGYSACGPTSLTMVLRAWYKTYPSQFPQLKNINLGQVIDFLEGDNYTRTQYADYSSGTYLPPAGQTAFAKSLGMDAKYFYGLKYPNQRLSNKELHMLTTMGFSVLVGLTDPKLDSGGSGIYPFITHWLNLLADDGRGDVTVRDSSNIWSESSLNVSSPETGIEKMSSQVFNYYYDGDAILVFPLGHDPIPGKGV